MIIGIDGNEANVKNRVGIGEYAFELLKQFEKVRKNGLKFVVYLKENPLSDMPEESDNLRYKVVGPKKAWTQFALPLNLYLEKNKPDVFFTPSHYSPRFSPVRTAISIMDLSYVHFPGLFNKDDLYQLTNWTRYSAKKASLIFTISNSSKDDIIREYEVDSKRVLVTHLGIKKGLESETKSLNMKDLQDKFGINKKYILFVGTLQPRKNIAKLIEAFSKIKQKDVDLVIVGKKGWLYEEILAAPGKFEVSDRVRFLDFVSDEDLPSIYRNAECFVLPSLYEGFGLPVLEAMKYGCPVIASNVSSLPEAGGDAALYIDPGDINDVVQKIEKLLTDKKLREEMIEKGYNQIKKFSWEKAAKQTLEALEELANE
jgi:glycosyltransferase involved in cell wall biosynthesis